MQTRSVEVIASAAYAATQNSKNQRTPGGARGLVVVIDATVEVATASVVFTIQGFDPVSGKYYTMLASAAVESVSTVVLRVFPGALASANLIANDVLPEVWRVNCVHADTDALTYSVGALYTE